MKREEVLRRLEERLARGEISEKTYLEIKDRYEKQPEEAELESSDLGDVEFGKVDFGGSAAQFGSSLERMVRDIVEPVLRNLDQVIPQAVQKTRDAIRIAGHGVVTGKPVQARVFRSSGSGVVEGDLEAVEVHVAGSCEFNGSVQADEFHAAGAATVKGNLKANEAHASGSLEVAGDLHSEELRTRGALRVGGNLDAKEVDIRGGVEVAGRFMAQEVLIEIGGDSRVTTMEAREITVRRPGGFFRGGRQLSADEITGTEVHLESTIANIVRGREVTIGPHCQIGAVEANELTVHESSEVRERRTPSGTP